MRSLKLITLAVFVLFSALVHAQVQAFLTTDQFWSAATGHYVDVNIALVAGSLVHEKNDAGNEQAKVEVLMIVEQEGEIVSFKKSVVSSPEVNDSLRGELIHSERFGLELGSYDLVLELTDLQNPESEISSVRKQFVVADLGKGSSFADIQLVETIQESSDEAESRYGFNMIPYIATYYPRQLSKLKFYCELYNTNLSLGEEADILITYSIRDFETASVHKNFKQVRRAKTQEVIPIIAEFDIAELPSGNFNLLIEVLDREGNLLADQQQFFQRNNPIQMDLNTLASAETEGTFVDKITEMDTLLLFVNCLRPIADDLERKMIDDRMVDRDPDLMRRFLYSFWFNRNAVETEEEWNAYWKEVLRVNRSYGTRLKQGYQTDRGYVHLKYGAPSTISDRPHDTDAYPYQIWHYYTAGRYNNRRFVFYLPDLVTNDYILLHSEVPGEVKEPRWNEYLHSRNSGSLTNLRKQQTNSASGSRAGEYFDMPR